MIQGGWSFVWAAYGIVWIGLLFYTLSLAVRQRELRREAQLLGLDGAAGSTADTKPSAEAP